MSVLGGSGTKAQSPSETQVQTFTVEEAVAFALKNYPAVRASLERVRAAEAGVGLARTSYLPRTDILWQRHPFKSRYCISVDAEPQCTRLCPPEPRLTPYGTLSTNTPEKALRTRKNTINQSAVTRSASGRLGVDMKMWKRRMLTITGPRRSSPNGTYLFATKSKPLTI
jgi:hypothetical protein